MSSAYRHLSKLWEPTSYPSQFPVILPYLIQFFSQGHLLKPGCSNLHLPPPPNHRACPLSPHQLSLSPQNDFSSFGISLLCLLSEGILHCWQQALAIRPLSLPPVLPSLFGWNKTPALDASHVQKHLNFRAFVTPDLTLPIWFHESQVVVSVLGLQVPPTVPGGEVPGPLSDVSVGLLGGGGVASITLMVRKL